MFKRIVLATDGTPVIERVVIFAGHIARTEHAEIVVVHAYDLPYQYESYAGFDLLREHYAAVAKAVVDDVVEELIADGVSARGVVHQGSAANVITSLASELQADLIVMGTRNGSILQHTLGSVSAQVLRYAHCPVLQVP